MTIVRIIGVCVITALMLFIQGCDDPEEKEIYLEGEPIPGIEIFVPLRYFTPDPMMPKISPDGTKLLFTGPTGIPEWKGLWVMDLASQEKILLNPDGRNADWAPDSEWIVFNVGSEIFKMKIDGTELVNLISGSGFFEPSWSPHFSFIYFGGNEGAGIINSDGGQVTIIPELGGQGSWHPFEKRIISSKEYNGTFLWRKFPVYDLTINQVKIVHNAAFGELNQYPKYAPDASQILFNGDAGMYLMTADGANVKRIIPSHLYGDRLKEDPKLYSAYPSWHPGGEDIIYEHFKITRSEKTARGRRVEGVIRFYKVNANEALAVSNLN